MTPREFLDQIVQPNIAEAEANFGDLRLALNAVHSIDALTAHIFHAATEKGQPVPKEDRLYRDNLAKDDDFRLLRDVAAALKHVALTHPKAGQPRLVKGADKIAPRSLGWDEAQWDELHWDGPPQVVVETEAGDLRALEAVMRAALAVLVDEMQRFGL